MCGSQEERWCPEDTGLNRTLLQDKTLKKSNSVHTFMLLYVECKCLFICLCVGQRSDAGGDDIEIPVESEAFMDDFFAQVFGPFVTFLK